MMIFVCLFFSKKNLWDDDDDDGDGDDDDDDDDDDEVFDSEKDAVCFLFF